MVWFRIYTHAYMDMMPELEYQLFNSLETAPAEARELERIWASGTVRLDRPAKMAEIKEFIEKNSIEVDKVTMADILNPANYAERIYAQLANMLGWQDFPFDVLTKNVDRIVYNYHDLVAERTGDDLSYEQCASDILENYTSDQAFALIGYDGDPNYCGSPQEKRYISRRPVIEGIMRDLNLVVDAEES